MKKIISLGFKVLNIIEILVAFIRVCVPLLFHLNLFQSVLNAAIYSFVLNKKKLSRIYISLAAFRKNSFTACLLYFYVFHHKKKIWRMLFILPKKSFSILKIFTKKLLHFPIPLLYPLLVISEFIGEAQRKYYSKGIPKS